MHVTDTIHKLDDDFMDNHVKEVGAQKSVINPSWSGGNNHTSGEIEHDDIPKLITDD